MIYDKINLTKSTSKNLSTQILIKVLIYRLDIYNLETKIVSSQDQENLLQKVVFSLVVSLNANTKNSQIKHCLCPIYVVIKKPNLNNLQTRKKT